MESAEISIKKRAKGGRHGSGAIKASLSPKAKEGMRKNPGGKKSDHQPGDPMDIFDSRDLLKVLTEVKNDNFTAQMPVDQLGIRGKICDTLNEIISLNEELTFEFTTAANTTGKQDKLTQSIDVRNAKGSYLQGEFSRIAKEVNDRVNSLTCFPWK
jgi:hypothetical protein